MGDFFINWAILLSSVEWKDCTCLNHDEMASFAAVCIGILFCTSFWEKPKEYIKHVATTKYEAFRDNLFKETNENKKRRLDSIEGMEYICEEVKANKDKLGQRLDSLYHDWYIPLATCTASIGTLVLFLGFSKTVGFWNLILTSPIFIYLFLCLKEYRCFKNKVTEWKNNISGCKKVLTCISQRQANALADTAEVKSTLKYKLSNKIEGKDKAVR